MWAGGLGQVFTGNVLEQYSLHVDAFNGNYEGLNVALLKTLVLVLMIIKIFT